MELFPAMRWGWLNGWILPSVFVLVFGGLLSGFSRKIVAKLYDRSGWRRHQRVVAALSKLSALACFILLAGTPLRIGRAVFVTGIVLSVAGSIFMSAALLSYNRTPPGRMVTRGPYRVSRNPQWLGMAAMLLGACVAIGSWTAVMLWLVSAVGYHFRILGEEIACVARYGAEYGDYQKRVPRYVFF